MSLSILVLVLAVVFAVCFLVIWRNIQQQQKRPRRRFKVGRSARDRAHPVRGKRMSYTELSREERDSPPESSKDSR